MADVSRSPHLQSYVFSLLTGYVDAPAGVKVDEGKAYNPYFAGGVIGMPQQLFDEGIEYADGTPATMSQQAKDVSTFLAWCSEPYFDERKKLGIKVDIALVVLTSISAVADPADDRSADDRAVLFQEAHVVVPQDAEVRLANGEGTRAAAGCDHQVPLEYRC